MSQEVHLTTIADSVIGALPCCDDPPLALALLRALTGGEPVPDSDLAAATGRDQAQVAAALARWPNVQRDEQGRALAFSGLSLRPTVHRFKRPTVHRFKLGERELGRRVLSRLSPPHRAFIGRVSRDTRRRLHRARRP